MCQLLRTGACLLALIMTAGCHTALHQPPRCCQHVEDHWGDCVERVGRSTSISNQRINRHVTRSMRKCGKLAYPY